MRIIQHNGFLLTILLAGALLAANSLSVASVSASGHVQHDELDDRQYDLELGESLKEPAQRVDGVWSKGSGGDTGSNGFYYSTSCNPRAEFFLDVKSDSSTADYTLSFYVPKSGSSPAATATAEVFVWQYTNGKWGTVNGSTSKYEFKSVEIDQRTGKGWRVPISRGEPITWRLRSGDRVAVQVWRSDDTSCNSPLAVDTVILRQVYKLSPVDDPGYMPCDVREYIHSMGIVWKDKKYDNKTTIRVIPTHNGRITSPITFPLMPGRISSEFYDCVPDSGYYTVDFLSYYDQLHCHTYSAIAGAARAGSAWDLEGSRPQNENQITWLRTSCNWNGGGDSSS